MLVLVVVVAIVLDSPSKCALDATASEVADPEWRRLSGAAALGGSRGHSSWSLTAGVSEKQQPAKTSNSRKSLPAAESTRRRSRFGVSPVGPTSWPQLAMFHLKSRRLPRDRIRASDNRKVFFQLAL